MRSERKSAAGASASSAAGGGLAGRVTDAEAFAAGVEARIHRLQAATSPADACREAREGVSLQLDGLLSQVGAARLRAHLDACARCRSYRAQLEGLTRALRTAPLVEPNLIVPALRPRLRARHHRRAWPTAAVAVAALAAATLVDLTDSLQVDPPAADSHGDTRLILKERQLLALDGVAVSAARAAPTPGRGVRRPVQAAESAAGAAEGDVV